MWILLFPIIAGKAAAALVFSEAPATAFLLWFGPDALLAYHLFAARAQGIVRLHRKFTTTQREVWLTIDDGPDPEDTPRILDLLAAHDARATFFVIGESAARHPELVRAIAAAGHEVAHHTHTHPLAWFWCSPPSRVHRELDLATATLRACGAEPVRFRPPAGIRNPWLGSAMRERGLTGIGWTASGLERRRGDAEAVSERLMKRLTPGAILLVHEGPRIPQAIRVHGVRRVLERLREHGYRCVVPEPGQLAG
ncbi:MAG TPA: polysaccharide deacetylase family protein [Opitutaceae bacterium]|nr:polysaccharide deacetylase family protein [Opitutaceae bacterium]